MNNIFLEIERLDFENLLWIIFAGLCLLNVGGDNI